MTILVVGVPVAGVAVAWGLAAFNVKLILVLINLCKNIYYTLKLIILKHILVLITRLLQNAISIHD